MAAGPMGVAVSLDATEQSTRPTRLLIDDSWTADTGSSVLPIPPGTHTVRCLLDGDIGGGSVSFEVEDPEGYYVDPASLCTIEATADFEPITVAEDDLLAGSMELFGLDPDEDFVASTHAGYPESPVERILLIVHGDEKVGMVWFEPAGSGRWTSINLATCA